MHVSEATRLESQWSNLNVNPIMAENLRDIQRRELNGKTITAAKPQNTVLVLDIKIIIWWNILEIHS